jgi:Family of unknown function (DUF5946)
MQIDLEKLTPPPLVNSTCTECGGQVPAQFQSCDAFLQFVLTDLKSAPPRLLIDAFAMQHPKRACKSAKSYASHFTGLCCGVEYGGSMKVYAAIGRWLSGPAERIGLTRPQEPEYRGQLTLRHVYGADVHSNFEPRLREWATDVWAAYTAQHDIARRWLETALKGTAPG